MNPSLDPEARDLLRLAKQAERDLPRDAQRVRARVLAAVGGVAAASSLSGHASAAGSAAAKASAGAGHVALGGGGLAGFGLVKVAAVVILLGLVGGAVVHRYRGADAPNQFLTQHRKTDGAALRSPSANVPLASEPSAEATSSAASLAPRGGLGVPNAPPPAVTSEPASTPQPARVSTPALSVGRVELGKANSAAVRSLARPAPVSQPQQAKQEDETSSAEPALEPKPAPDKTPSASSVTTTNAGPHSIISELRALRSAQQALNAGAPTRTLVILRDVHGGELLAERSALEIFALCALGQTRAAQQKAALFRSIASSSPLLPRVNASCAKP